MGFSISGAAAIIFASAFVAFGMWYSAAATSFERVSEAQQVETDRVLETRNAAISVWNATYNATTESLHVRVNNTGATQFRLDDVQLLVDGRFATGWLPNATVAGQGATELWFGAETLSLNHTVGTAPDRVKVIAGLGAADTAEVTQV